MPYFQHLYNIDDQLLKFQVSFKVTISPIATYNVYQEPDARNDQIHHQLPVTTSKPLCVTEAFLKTQEHLFQVTSRKPLCVTGALCRLRHNNIYPNSSVPSNKPLCASKALQLHHRLPHFLPFLVNWKLIRGHSTINNQEGMYSMSPVFNYSS